MANPRYLSRNLNSGMICSVVIVKSQYLQRLLEFLGVLKIVKIKCPSYPSHD